MFWGTKAGTLASLEGRLSSATVLPQVHFTVDSWCTDPAGCFQNIEKQLGLEMLIVRSSAIGEDSMEASMAGSYDSVGNVSGKLELRNAIEQVIESFGDKGSPIDEILVQPMLTKVVVSGVALNVDPNTLSPYRVINYARGNDTSTVTAGGISEVYVHAKNTVMEAPEEMRAVLAIIEELEEIESGQPMDIEFAILDGENLPILLQARRLALQGDVSSASDLNRHLAEIEAKVRQGMQSHPFLHGERTVYGIMPDWNPAEIIGVRPRPLALSLYRELITDSIWAYQRHNYGYKNLRSFPLLHHFHGLPYIDVRVSFNSFIPREIGGELADKLVDYYIERLLGAPTLHDKIEFEIVFSCYTLDLPSRLEELKKANISDEEIRNLTTVLRDLTNRIIRPENGLWVSDRDKLAVLSSRREKILSANLSHLEKVYWLLEDCKRYGTLPFAGLARAGFIAVQMLKSMVTEGLLSDQDYEHFMAGVITDSTLLVRDHREVSREDFLVQYGHLRPGTYDILSPRYDETPDLYFTWESNNASIEPETAKSKFTLTIEQTRSLEDVLSQHGLETDVVGLFHFLESGIVWRERAKFLFTQNLSDALSLIGDIGESFGFTREEMSYCDIGSFYDMHGGVVDEMEILRANIEEGQRRYEITRGLWLPPLITSPEDVWRFHLPDSEPNYITQKSVTSRIANSINKSELQNSIVMIPTADPGFDWLFSHAIAGLITAYGGVNSHMAIRAGELGIPAVIGIGESLFNRLANAKALSIDCATKRIEVLT